MVKSYIEEAGFQFPGAGKVIDELDSLIHTALGFNSLVRVR